MTCHPSDPAQEQNMPEPFYGAQCPSYPACSGGCGLGCTHEIETRRAALAAQVQGMQAEFIKKVVEALRQPGSHQVVADLIAALAQGSISDQEPVHGHGYAIVPLLPTPRMIEVGCDNNPTQWNDGTSYDFAADVANDVYVAMVRAAGGAISDQVEEKREANAIWRGQNDEKWRQAMRDLREMFILGEDLKVMERRIFDLIMFGPEVVAVVKGNRDGGAA